MSERDAGRVPVTVVIAARDESANIAACIESADWASEILVADGGSRDDTVERARAAGARVIIVPGRTVGAQRNVAIAEARCDWIVVLDADERATGELAEEIQRIIKAGRGVQAYRIPRRNHFLGREIRGGWGHDRPVRFFRRELRYDERPVHEHVVVRDPVGTLASRVVHRPYRNLDQWFAKLDTYSRWWAEQEHARGRRGSAWAVALRPPTRFFTSLVLRHGWRDGQHGVVVAMLAACSVAAKYARLWELSRGTRPSAKS